MTRPEDWPMRLSGFLEVRRLQPFAWGTNDCATFAADWIVELTATDPLGDLRGAWATDREALTVIAAEGGLEQAALARMGEPISVLFARRGDLVLLETGGRDAFGVCVGEDVAAPGEEGTVFLPMSAARLAWRI